MTESPLPRNRPIQEADVPSLIASQVREDRSIEFKSEYLPAGDSGKKRFLQSVAAFANVRGGDLVRGLKEEGGVAAGWAPLEGIDVDQCRLQILDLTRAHLEPRLGGVEVEGVLLAAGGHVLVVRVPKSWSGPHIERRRTATPTRWRPAPACLAVRARRWASRRTGGGRGDGSATDD